MTKDEIRQGLKKLLRSRLDDFKETVEQAEEERNEAIEKSGGKFARDYI